MDQYQRKDSVSSEVAALLCISGRTSRISSVGSQGSAVSRLSALSGISRSPSPHKMILETSFCGPKPVDNQLDSALTAANRPSDALEQILLSRKHDPTQAVLAEGISVAQIEKMNKDLKNGAVGKTSSRKHRPQQQQQQVTAPEVKITRPQGAAPRGSGSSASSENKKTIVGKTQSGTQYIRIKLKPDHEYNDQGLGANEEVVVDSSQVEDMARKPVSLNIHKQSAAVQKSEPRKSSVSPKPSKHIFNLGKEPTGSRSPSPATVVSASSRKNSFCSLFKSKEATPDSPTAFQIRKKSSASARENDEAHSHRSRSCGKIKDMGGGGAGGEKLSPSPTPSKQKSVLGIFKTKRSGSASKSKSSSPVDHEERRVEGTSPVASYYTGHQAQPVAGGSKARLRYYETPADNSGIYIPLHTPPEEKGLKVEDEAQARYNEMLDKQLHETELGRSILRSMNKPIRTPETSPKVVQRKESHPLEPDSLKQDEITAAPTISPSLGGRKLSDQIPRIRKSSRIEYPDGSIRIPLRSPSDEEVPAVPVAQVCQVQVECVPQPQAPPVERTRATPLENVVDNKPLSPPGPPPPALEAASVIASSSSSCPAAAAGPEVHSPQPVEVDLKNSKVDMVPLTQPTVPHQQIATEAAAAEPSAALENIPSEPPPPTREKKHILFTTKIGSAEEQVFQTQFSVSKTESLCSPTSEANNTQAESTSGPEDKETRAKGTSILLKDTKIEQQGSGEQEVLGAHQSPDGPSLSLDTKCSVTSVTVQMPQVTTRRRSRPTDAFSTDDEMSANEVMMVVSKGKELAKTKRRDSRERSQEERPGEGRSLGETPPPQPPPKPQRSAEAMDYKLGPQRTSTTEENAVASSGSERDSEATTTATDTTRSRKHLPHNLAIDEHESTGLVSQISYEDELPYVPTTLPEERLVGIPIIPVKERATMEVKTYPVERPRSTTPLNPSFVDDYCVSTAEVETPTTQKGEKLKISLPRKDSRDKIQKPRSPRRVSNSGSGKCWFEFEATRGAADGECQFDEPPPPPLPPRAATTSAGGGQAASPPHPPQWINFENIPEKRKPPKRITTVPQKDPAMGVSPSSTTTTMGGDSATVYQFVKPDECQCECHEMERKVSVSGAAGGCGTETTTQSPATTEEPLLTSSEEAQPLLGSDSNGTTKGSEGCNSMR